MEALVEVLEIGGGPERARHAIQSATEGRRPLPSGASNDLSSERNIPFNRRPSEFSGTPPVSSRNHSQRILATPVTTLSHRTGSEGASPHSDALTPPRSGGACYFELPRMALPRTSVNKAMRKARA
jgi:hypothetical protein